MVQAQPVKGYQVAIRLVLTVFPSPTTSFADNFHFAETTAPYISFACNSNRITQTFTAMVDFPLVPDAGVGSTINGRVPGLKNLGDLVLKQRRLLGQNSLARSREQERFGSERGQEKLPV